MYKEHEEFKVTGFPGTMVVGIEIREESMVPGHFGFLGGFFCLFACFFGVSRW